MKKILKKLLMVAGMTGLLMAATAAQAGYYDWYGIYHPTCVPGYWAQGFYGPYWVPTICG